MDLDQHANPGDDGLERRLPLIIMAGSDREPAVLPPSGRGKHSLVGHKAIDVQIRGRPLISVLIERLMATRKFAPIFVAGPRRVYAGAVGEAIIIDTDAAVADNLRTAISVVRRTGLGGHLAFTTCDILPKPADVSVLLADYQQRPCAVWFPLIRAPEDQAELREFAWKPEYRIVQEPGDAPVRVLPGHLLIADPDALRLDFVLQLLAIAYQTRNRSIATRRGAMMRQVTLSLLAQDALNLLCLRPPILTVTVLANGLGLARELRSGMALRSDLEQRVAKIVIARRYRRHFPDRGVRLPILPALTWAEDVDTKEEARQVAGDEDASLRPS
jgi:hypothetical protein